MSDISTSENSENVWRANPVDLDLVRAALQSNETKTYFFSYEAYEEYGKNKTGGGSVLCRGYGTFEVNAPHKEIYDRAIELSRKQIEKQLEEMKESDEDVRCSYYIHMTALNQF